MTYSSFEKIPNKAISNNLDDHKHFNMHTMMFDFNYKVKYLIYILYISFIYLINIYVMHVF